MLEMNYKSVLFSIDLEISNVCINSCTICPRDRLLREKGFMKRKTLNTLINALTGFNPIITISGMGDPLEHRDYLGLIDVLKRNGFATGIVVNIASILRMDNLKLQNLLDSGLNQITISIPSMRREVLKKILPGVESEIIYDKIKNIAEKCRGNVGLRVSGILTEKNRDEKDDFKRFFADLNIPVWTSPIHSRGGNLTESELYKRKEIKQNSICRLFLFHTFITINGDVLACCHDLTGETNIGNISEGFMEILGRKNKIINRQPYFNLCNSCDEPLRFIKLPDNYQNMSAKKFFFSLRKKF